MHSHNNHFVTTLHFFTFFLSGQYKNYIGFYIRENTAPKNIAVLILDNGWRAGVIPGISSAKATLCKKTVLDHSVLFCVCICIAVLDHCDF